MENAQTNVEFLSEAEGWSELVDEYSVLYNQCRPAVASALDRVIGQERVFFNLQYELAREDIVHAIIDNVGRLGTADHLVVFIANWIRFGLQRGVRGLE